jgi:hypothetical protein
MFMRFISIEYPKKDYDVAKLEHLVKSYQKRCEPNVMRHMNDSSLLEFKPRNDNFSEPSFKIQLTLLMKRQVTYMIRQPLISAAQVFIAVASGLISLAVFFKIRERDPKPVSAEINMIGSIFFLAANVFVSIVYSSIMSF